MALTLVEDEILKNAEVSSQRDGEDDTKYRARLVRAGVSLVDDRWRGLSEPTQVWVNDGAAAINAKVDVPDFPEGLAPEPTMPEPEPPKPARKHGACNYLRTLYITNPDLTLDELLRSTRDAGYTITWNTASNSYQETKACLKLLKELNLLK